MDEFFRGSDHIRSYYISRGGGGNGSSAMEGGGGGASMVGWGRGHRYCGRVPPSFI